MSQGKNTPSPLQKKKPLKLGELLITVGKADVHTDESLREHWGKCSWGGKASS